MGKWKRNGRDDGACGRDGLHRVISAIPHSSFLIHHSSFLIRTSPYPYTSNLHLNLPPLFNFNFRLQLSPYRPQSTHVNRYAFLKDRFWIYVNTLVFIAISRNIECQGAIDDGLRRKKRLTITKRLEDRSAIGLQKRRHIKSAHMPRRKITVDLSSLSWLNHANLSNHLNTSRLNQ